MSCWRGCIERMGLWFEVLVGRGSQKTIYLKSNHIPEFHVKVEQ